MNTKIPALTLATLLAATGTFAAEEPSTEDLDAKLKSAHQRLEQAARDVAELSQQIGQPFVRQFNFSSGERRAIIGVQLDPNSGKDGARVDQVSPGGPAATAGIRAGDVIVAVDGRKLEDDPVRDVTRLVRRVKPDTKVKVRVMRDGKPMDFDVVAIARPFSGNAFSFDMPDPPPGLDALPEWLHGWRGAFSGMELATLTPQLGKYFGTEEGVLVVRAPAADALRLEDGDVILSIDGRKPTSGSHATRILRSYQSGEKVSMRIMRKQKAMDLDVTLPERMNERRARNPRPEERA